MDKLTIFFIILILIIDVYCIITSKNIKFKQKSYGELTKEDIFIIKKSLNNMDGREFEEFIGFILEKIGYKVEITQATNDGGKDIILNNTIYVECKAYCEMNTIGRPVIQKLIGAAVTDEITEAIIVTTTTLTKSAIECIDKCKAVNIQVLYLEDILDICKGINRYEFNNLFEFENPYVV